MLEPEAVTTAVVTDAVTNWREEAPNREQRAHFLKLNSGTPTDVS
jgi:hypothetical protein